MNLVEFIQQHQNAHTINYIKSGFQKSLFASNITELSTLMKLILNTLLSDSDRQKIFNQLQSGGLPTNIVIPTKVNETCKKQSFCTEFSIMISNIVGLLGFEFSKYTMFLFGIKHFMKQMIIELSNCTTYAEIGACVNKIRNIFLLGRTGNENMSSPIMLDSEFDYTKYATIMSSNGKNDISINYFAANSDERQEDIIFNWIMKNIQTHVKNDNIITFNDDKALFINIITDMIDHVKMDTYNVNDVNDLIINLGKYNVCYDKSFIKMFDILYKEGFSDIPTEMRTNWKPHVIYIENDLKLDVNVNKYLLIINKYFHDKYDGTLKCIMEVMPDDYMPINISDGVFEMLSDITLNLLVNMCRKIYNNQLIYGYFGKSTRIQFIQVFQAFMDCVPRYYTLTKSQRTVVHYILLSDKILEDSIESVNRLNGKGEEDDDGDNDEKNESNENENEHESNECDSGESNRNESEKNDESNDGNDKAKPIVRAQRKPPMRRAVKVVGRRGRAAKTVTKNERE